MFRPRNRGHISGNAVFYNHFHTADPRCHHRRSTGQRLQGHQAKALVVRRHDQHIRGAVVQRQFFLIDPSGKSQVIPDIQRLCFGQQPLKHRRMFSVSPDHYQSHRGTVLNETKSFEQSVQPFYGGISAHIEYDGVLYLNR